MPHGADGHGQASRDGSIERRVEALERLMAESIVRLDRLQHLAEILLDEAHARRLDEASGAMDSGRWSTGGFPLLPRNLPVRFGTDVPAGHLDPQDFLADDWYPRETWGTWGQGATQAIRFALQDYRGGYATVRLELCCFVPAGRDKPSVHFIANGYYLGSHNPGGTPQSVKLRLPPSCIGNGDILLQFQHDAPITPASTGTSTDERLLGAGIVSLSAG